MDEDAVYVAVIVSETETVEEHPVMDMTVHFASRFEAIYDPPLPYTEAAFERHYPSQSED